MVIAFWIVYVTVWDYTRRKGSCGSPDYSDSRFHRKKGKKHGGGGGGGEATGFLSSHSDDPIRLHTNGSRVSLSFIVWFIALWTRRLRWFTWDAFSLYLSSFTLEAHCRSLMDLGTCDCIQFPLYVIVGEKSAAASDCKLMASKLTGFPAAALRLYYGGKGGVFYFPLKLLNKCWPSKIAYINHNDPPPPSPKFNR